MVVASKHFTVDLILYFPDDEWIWAHFHLFGYSLLCSTSSCFFSTWLCFIVIEFVEGPYKFRIKIFCHIYDAILLLCAFFTFLKIIFYWSIVELKCCVNYCWYSKMTQLYTYIHPQPPYMYIICIYISFFILFSIMVCLRILNIVACAGQ